MPVRSTDPTTPTPTPPAKDEPALRLLWRSPFPATLQDAEFRLVDVNDAFVAFCGRSRASLIGLDPVVLQPAEDRADHQAARQEALRCLQAGEQPPAQRRRLIDADGQARWFLLQAQNLGAQGQPARWLSILQDVTPEVAERAQARRAQDELAHWFELSGIGMLVYDHDGLIVRCNRAFEALVVSVPDTLHEAPAELQALLAWEDGRPHAALVSGAPALECQALVPLPGGQRRRLSARVSCLAAEPGQRRLMAVVHDRSAEDERDLAQLERGMVMDTASVGVATYDPVSGPQPLLPGHERWVAPRAANEGEGPAPPAAPVASGALLHIGRELVEPASRPEYDRLQRALRLGERAEVRYAVRHPEMGPRWLLTRIEPGRLAGGRSTTSVVTLDVTEQELAQRRGERLLRELTTILDSTTAGIAYLRAGVLVRCNRRFERLLGYAPDAAAGASLEELLHRQPERQALIREAEAALADGRPFEAQLQAPAGADGKPVWYSLSVRRAEPADAAAGADEAVPEAVALLTDISHLKSQQAELEQLLRERELMFSLSDVGIIYLRGVRIERANQAMAALTGYAAPELMLLDASELYDSARDCVAFEARVAQGLRDQGRFQGERQLRRRDGSLLWVQVAVRAVALGNPEAGLICSFVDVDDRHRARESLSLQAEGTRAILNSVLVGIVTVSGRGIEWMNRSARRMFAGELADFVGEPIAIVATPEPEHPLRRADWLQRLQHGQAETFECRLQGRDGRTFWVAGNVVATPAASSGWQLTFALLDIERRRQAELRIAQAQASLQRVIETAPLAIALFSTPSLRVLQLNQMASSFFCCPLASALGAAPEAFAAPTLAAALRAWLADAAPGVPEALQREWRDDAAGRVWDVRVMPLAATDGSVAADASQLLVVASDVSEQRAAERARLQAAIDQREVLVREVHHRIKNNLQGVAGLLQQNAARHPEMATVLSEAVGQVQAIAQVYGLQVGSGGPLKVAGMLRAIALSVQRTFGRTIAVELAPVELPHELPEAESIPIALTLNELLTNAVKHGTGSVRCSAVAHGDDVSLVVAGSGRLAEGFDLARYPGGVSGLGLVRALLPRRSARLSIEQRGGEVVAEVRLTPPSVRLPAPAQAPLSEAPSVPAPVA